MLHQYLLDLSILPKEKKLEREGDITGLLEVTIKGCFPMERYTSREKFGFERYLIVSTIRRTIVNKLVMIFLQHIMTLSFISLDMFTV